jgi:hypothetical protein
MNRLFARLSLGLAFTGLVVMAAPPCHAAGETNGVEEGRTRFTRGLELYKEGNFHAALAEFRAAYAAAPSYRLQYNLGQTLYQLQDYAGAVRAFDQFLTEGGDKIDAERRKEVEGELAKLRQRVAKLTFTVNVPAAEIAIDDEPKGTAQKGPVLVSAGRRRVSVTASGYQTETRVIDVAGAQSVELKFELKPIGGLVANPDPTKKTDTQTKPKSRAPFYIGLVATGVLGGTTAAFAIVTAGKHSDYETALGTPGVSKSTIDDKRSATRTTALVADVFGGATILAAGLTVMAFVFTSGDEPVTVGKTEPKPTVRPVAGPGSFGVVGTF